MTMGNNPQTCLRVPLRQGADTAVVEEVAVGELEEACTQIQLWQKNQRAQWVLPQ